MLHGQPPVAFKQAQGDECLLLSRPTDFTDSHACFYGGVIPCNPYSQIWQLASRCFLQKMLFIFGRLEFIIMNQ